MVVSFFEAIQLGILFKRRKGAKKLIGTWENGKYKTTYDFKNHIDYLEYMYGKTKGFIADFRFLPDKVPLQKLFTYKKLIANTYKNAPDAYISMNSFRIWNSRKTENIKSLNALYTDIDCYKHGFTPEQVIFTLEQDYFDRVIPCPTFIIKSGRGLYLIWKIYQGEDRKALPIWQKVQEYLYEKLKLFGADRQALDAARVLRVPGSVHSETGNTVTIANFNDVQYTLDEIIEEFDIETDKCKSFVNKAEKPNKCEQYIAKMPKKRWGEATERQIECATEICSEQNLELPNFSNFDETFDFIGRFAQRRFKSDKSATAKQKAYAKKIAEEKRLDLPDFNDFNATANFIALNSNKKPYDGNGNSFLDYWRRDIETLITSRRGEDCCRELCLFLYRLWLCETTRDYERALKATLELNSRLDKPFTESYVKSNTKSAEEIIKRGDTYKYSKKNIIELLKITDDEMKSLMYLNKLTKKEREAIRKRKAYEKRLEEKGEKSKKEKIKERREEIAKMLNEGKTEKEIIQALQISRRTYYSDKLVIISQGLVKRAVRAVKAAGKEVNRIKNNITEVIKEIYENIKDIKERNLEHEILKQIKKVRKKC